MRKLLQTLWLPLIFLLLPLQLDAQNGWVAYNVPSPGGGIFSFGSTTSGIITGQFNYYRTTNSGSNWSSFPVPNSHPNNDYPAVFFLNENTGWLGLAYYSFPLAGGNIYKTTNGGLNWVNAAGMATGIRDIQFMNENTGFIATGSIPMFHTEGYIARSTNGGSNWQTIGGAGYTVDIDFINESTGWGIGFIGDDVGLHIDLMIRTNNGGDNWTTLIRDSVPTAQYDLLKKVQFLNSNTGYLLRTKLFKSINGGDNWSLIDTSVFSGRNIRSFYFIDENTGWVAATGAMFHTTNGGNNWSMQNVPVNITGDIYFANSSTGWALANNTTILKTTTGGVTSIQSISSKVPDSYRLHQNYPNPFNPETKIKFEIPLSVRGEKSEVRLSVYDISGKEVRVLLNSQLASGVYEYSFDGAGLGSGVYFYTLKTENYSATKKMILIK